MSKWDALQKARELGIDLVEIGANAKPPVVKLIEFKKFKYLEAKKEKESKKRDKGGELKEVRLRPFTDDHDLEIRLKKAQEWLKENNKVRFVIKFSGREMAHPEFGFSLATRIFEKLKEFSDIEKPAHFEGRQIVITLQPSKKQEEKVEQHAKS